ncbi:alpha/beta hydrolase fold-3 domain-containing protein [Colletotrichum sublineola]|nr:alpha/beta hydrolase fold-3 domain-containing protein [Colletotrichum sublineola]
MEYNTGEKIAQLSVLDPDIEEYLKTHDALSTEGPRKPDTDFDYSINVRMRDGYLSETRIHKPPNPSGAKSPVIVLLYGGGFVTGDCRQLGGFARVATRLFNATVVNLSYRLAPANPFPAAPNDVWDGLKWVAGNAQTLGGDTSVGFILGGVSAGGNLAAVTAQKTVDGTDVLTPPLTGLWLCIPVIAEEDAVPTQYRDLFFAREQNAEAPILGAAAFARIRAAYAPQAKSPDYSPFNSAAPHKGMPPTFLQVAGKDFLRDDGMVYERALREHGVETRLEVYPGAPHGHIAFRGENIKSSIKARVDIFKGLAWLLKVSVAEGDIRTELSREF